MALTVVGAFVCEIAVLVLDCHLPWLTFFHSCSYRHNVKHVGAGPKKKDDSSDCASDGIRFKTRILSIHNYI